MSRERPTLAGAHRDRGRSRVLEDLRRSTPAEALALLVPGDPLGARAVVRERLEGRALLLDADRVTLRALARCARYLGDLGTARGAAGAVGRRAARWLALQVDSAIDELLGSEARGDPPPSEASPTVVEQLARPLRLDVDRARAACVAFNACPTDERRAFHGVFLRGVPLEDAARSAGVPVATLARRARRALEATMEAALGPAPPADAEPPAGNDPPVGKNGGE